jgi:tetratricopeptide (TPR) repeat protein
VVAASTRPHDTLLLAALCVALLVAYSSSFHAGLVQDSRVLVAQDPRITAVTPGNLRLILTQGYWFGGMAGLYRPLSTLSYLFNYSILASGADPFGYHAVNFFIHAGNAALVFTLGLLVFHEKSPAYVMTAVWALHPVLTEAVTNVAGRPDLLAGSGVLGALVCHARASAAAGWRRALWLSLLVLALAAGMFSKETAVAAPALIALYDLTATPARPWRARLPGYIAAALVVSLFLVVRSRVLAGLPPMHIPFTDNPMVATGFLASRLTAITVIGWYLWLLIWPAALSSDYSFNQVPPFHWQPGALLAVVACAGVMCAAVASYRRHKPIFFFIGFFFVTLLPTANLLFLLGTIMAERFLYLPAIAFAGCLAAVLRRRQAWAVPAILSVICLAYAARTYARNSDWHDDLSLWSSAVRAAPDSYKTHMALASADAESLDRAVAEIERALAIVDKLPDDRNSPVPYIDAGSYYGRKGESLASDPASAAWYRKSLDVLLRARRIEAANNRAPAHPLVRYELYLSLGDVYRRLGQPGLALEALEYERRHGPVPEFFEKIAAIHASSGDLHRAAVSLLEGRAVNPGYTGFDSPLLGALSRHRSAGLLGPKRSAEPGLPARPRRHLRRLPPTQSRSRSGLPLTATPQAGRIAFSPKGC